MNISFDRLCDAAGLPIPLREHKFHPERRFRFDYCWPDKKLAMEVDGGLFIHGGHSRGAARESDYEKDFLAMKLGWRVLRVSTGQIRKGIALRWVMELMNQ